MILVENVKKSFKLYGKPSDRLKEIAFRRSYHRIHNALDGISFTVRKGETLGILGKNGAGKSTLLKVLTGVLMPDSGSISVDGKITALLELGTGFDSNLSGLENIVSNGLLIGMTRPEIEQRRQAIIEFSELGEYISEPLRTYSSGMVMRLAFSIAIHADPEYFIIDEALSVGDAHFQQKCMKRIRQFREQGGSIIFVSHDLNAMKLICDRVLVLDRGQVVADGAPEEAVNFYNRIIAAMDREDEAGPKPFQPGPDGSYGSKLAEIVDYEFAGEESGGRVVTSGEKAFLKLGIRAHGNIPELTIGIMIRDRFGQDIFGINSFLLDAPVSMRTGERLEAIFKVPMDIGPGKYTITAALHTRENHLDQCFHWCDNLVNFEVAGIKGALFGGLCRLRPELTLSRENSGAMPRGSVG